MVRVQPKAEPSKLDCTRLVDCTLGDVRQIAREECAEGTPATAPEVLTTEQACQFLQVSRATLHRLVLAGRVRRRMLGDSPRFLRLELIEDLKGGAP